MEKSVEWEFDTYMQEIFQMKEVDIKDRRATGFEALLGYLYLKKEWKRMLELVKIGLDSIKEQ